MLSQIGILAFADTFASFFGPLFGVMIADYYLIKNKKLSNKDIYSLDGEGKYFYSGVWHLKGIYSLFLGFIFSSSTSKLKLPTIKFRSGKQKMLPERDVDPLRGKNFSEFLPLKMSL